MSIIERVTRCPATCGMMGRTYRCEMWRGHGGIHFSDRLRPLMAVQWLEGWQEPRPTEGPTDASETA